MKQFHFTLETLRTLREAKLEQQEHHLAVAVTAYNRKKGELDANRKACAKTWDNLNSDPRQSHADYLYVQRLEKQSQEIDAKMHETHLAMEEEKKRYAAMRKDLRVLEKLRENQYREHKRKLELERDEEAAEMSRAHKLFKFLSTIPFIG